MKEQQPTHQPPLMSFQATHYEIISINLAIAYFMKYGGPPALARSRRSLSDALPLATAHQ